MSDIIDFATRRPKARTPAIPQFDPKIAAISDEIVRKTGSPDAALKFLKDYEYLRTLQGATFQGLPFVSAECSEYGWPDSAWVVEPSGDDHADRDRGKEFARMAMAALESDNGRGRALERTLDAIISQQARIRAKGGKGSRSLTPAATGFLSELSALVARKMSRRCAR